MTEPTPYEQGMAVARMPPDEQPECPYPEGSSAADQWREGYGDETEAMILANGGEDD